MPCIRALTLPPGSLLRFQENNVNSPWLGIDDTDIRSAIQQVQTNLNNIRIQDVNGLQQLLLTYTPLNELNNYYTKTTVDNRFSGLNIGSIGGLQSISDLKAPLSSLTNLGISNIVGLQSVLDLKASTSSLSSSLGDFFTKSETTSNYYSKSDVDSNFYNKTYIDTTIGSRQHFYTSANVGWVNLGTLTTAQNGHNFRIDITNCQGYNANENTNNMIWVHFKTSNGVSFQTAENGSNFYGDCVAYFTGPITNNYINSTAEQHSWNELHVLSVQ